MLLLFLGLIDLASSIMLFLSLARLPPVFGLGPILSIILILKALYSIPNKSYFAGVVDIICAAFLILAGMHIYLHYSLVMLVSFMLLVKGVQSIIPEVLG